MAASPRPKVSRLIARDRRVTLPSDSDATLAGRALAAIGELAVEAGEQPRVLAGGELGAGGDPRGIARRTRTVDRERRTRQRDEGSVDRAIGMEFMHPRQPCVWRQHHSIGKSEPSIELSAQESRQGGYVARAEGQTERACGAGRHRIRFAEAVLPELGKLHGGKRCDGKPAPSLLGAHFHAPAEKIAAEVSRRRLGWPDAHDAARLAVAERAEGERARRIERAPGLDPVAAEVRPFEMPAGDAIAH